MNKIIVILAVNFLTLCLLNGCGFKTTKQAEIYLVQVNMSGDKRFSNKIKNSVMLNFKNENNKKYILDLKIKKTKKIKEKKNNKIIKYEINLITDGSIKDLQSSKSKNFNINMSNEFSVNSSHYLTTKSEQDTLKNIIEKTIEEIINNINLEIN